MKRVLLLFGVGFLLCGYAASSVLFAQTTEPAGAKNAWEDLQTAKQNFYKAQPPSLEKKEFDRFLKEYSERAGKLADRFKEYQARYAASTNATEAWEEWMDLLDIAAHGSAARRAELDKMERDYLADPKLSRSQCSRIRFNQIGRLEDLKAREQLVRKVKGEAEEPTEFFCQQMLDLAEFSEYPHSREIVEEILKLTGSAPTVEEFLATGRTNTNGPAWKAWLSMEKSIRDRHHGRALETKKQLDRIGHPLALQFTALDGTKVDLERYRGKVVLLDFWATWCPPCVGGLPEVKAVWQKFRPKGFEVIGISYDDERPKLEKFLKQNGFSWPQFFDPAGLDSALVQSLGKPGPPAYWLVDRQGRVADLNAKHDLERKVKRLLEADSKPASVK